MESVLLLKEYTHVEAALAVVTMAATLADVTGGGAGTLIFKTLGVASAVVSAAKGHLRLYQR